MSQNNMETDNNGESGNKIKRAKKRSFIEILIPVLTFMTIVNCIVILVLVVNIGKKVNGLEQRLLVLQNNDADEPYQEASVMISTDINGNTVDESEAVDIAEAAEIGRAHV